MEKKTEREITSSITMITPLRAHMIRVLTTAYIANSFSTSKALFFSEIRTAVFLFC